MGVLNKPYEISVWEDQLNNGVFSEKKICVIGSNEMTSQSRAINPKLVSNVNGTNTFTFSIYYRYKDNITGENIDNPFAQYLTNERKLKLKYGKWYDFIIKNVKVDSNKYIYDITATDQYINELSKNGFDFTFDAELNNNTGSVQTLAARALEPNTDWHIEPIPTIITSDQYSEFIPDIAEESLVRLQLTENIIAVRLIDQEHRLAPIEESNVTIEAGEFIYGFYSCCIDQTPRFQFIYIPDRSQIKIDSERIIKVDNCQYYTNIDEYIEAQSDTYRLPIPRGMQFGRPSQSDPDTGEIISNYRGGRYNFSPDMFFNSVANCYVTIYTKNDTSYYGFSKTEYKAPNLISNWVTNPNTYKSTAGWRVGITQSGITKGKIENEAVYNGHTLIEDLQRGAFNPDYTYTARLHYTADNVNKNVLVNTGFYDNRRSIYNLLNGTEYVLKIKTNAQDFTIQLGRYKYEVANSLYDLNNVNNKTFLKAEFNQSTPTTDDGYKYIIAKVGEGTGVTAPDYTPNTFKIQPTGSLALMFIGLPNNTIIEDFQVFEYIPSTDSNIPFVNPEDQIAEAKVVTTYFLYDAQDLTTDLTKTLDDFVPIYCQTTLPEYNGYTVVESCEKRRAVTVKESNYFNIIQTICENFQCWVDFVINHNTDGSITGKHIYFHNYIGQQNYAGFRYGVNLKSIARTDDSKQIVTKLVVKQNSNEFGINGFCTISRAPSNETGENYIYNMDPYIKQGLLDVNDWNTSIYNTNGAEGQDIDPNDTSTNSNGYYVRLSLLNNRLSKIADNLANQSITLAKAQADVTQYTSGKISAEDQFEEAQAQFLKLTGRPYTQCQYVDTQFLEKNIKYLINCAESYQATKDYTSKLEVAENYLHSLEQEYTDLVNEQNIYINYKEALNKAFYSKFSRFIQEGTWNSEDYYDDEKYYLDALNTSFNSAKPAVSYTISVLELSQLPEYQGFTFTLGDQTFMEDPDFFGYDINGAPVREDVTLTEITYCLDQPDKNQIKVQTYKNQFQDLFKKISATVQSVQLSTGSYERSAEFVETDDSERSKFLQGALSDAGTILENLAEQTVRLDASGLTITDSIEKNKSLRAVGGGILFTEDGGETWALAITAQGINASRIKAGTLDVANVNIMFGEEPTFRWDSYGLTAYNFNIVDYTPVIDLYKGVRFDRLGIYGFTLSSGDGADWHPTDVVEWEIHNGTIRVKPDNSLTNTYYVRNHSVFELTKNGFYLSLGEQQYHYCLAYDLSPTTLGTPITHISKLALGRVEDILYNAWGDNGYPYYDPTSTSTANFIKVFSIKDNTDSEQLVIYDDGTLVARNVKFTGSVEWAPSASPTRSVYSETSQSAPEAGRTNFPDTSHSDWHNIKGSLDRYYAHTDNGGNLWNGPMLITGRGIESIEFRYGISTSSTVAPSSWSSTIPDLSNQQNKYLWTQQFFHYTDGDDSHAWQTTSIVRIAQDGASAWTLSLSNDAEPMPTDYDGQGSSSWQAAFNAQIIKDGTPQPLTGWIFQEVVSGTINQQTKSVSTNQVSYVYNNLSTDTASVTITATNTSTAQQLSATFTAFKVKGGTPGSSYNITVNPTSMGLDQEGNYTPNSIVVGAQYRIGQEEPDDKIDLTSQLRISVNGSELPSLTQTFNANTTISYTYTIAQIQAALGSSAELRWIECSWYIEFDHAGYPNTFTKIDWETIEIAKDGIDGQDGADGNAYTIGLTNDFVSYGTGTIIPTSDSPVTLQNISTGIRAYHNGESIAPGTSGYTITYSIDPNNSVTISSFNSTTWICTLGQLKAMRGQIRFALTYNNIVVATTSFEISANVNGESGSYTYIEETTGDLARSSNFTPKSNIICSAYTSTSTSRTAYNGYWTYALVINGTEGSIINGGQSSSLTIVTTDANWKQAGLSGVVIRLYSDSSHTSLIDQTLINVINDGADGAAGAPGTPGQDGDSITILDCYYYTGTWSNVQIALSCDTSLVVPVSSEVLDTWTTYKNAKRTDFTPNPPAQLFTVSFTKITKTVSGISSIEFTIPTLINADDGSSGISGDTLATFYRLTNGSKQGMYYDENGNLYINSTMLNTVAIRVANRTTTGQGNVIETVVFAADSTQNFIRIGGFAVWAPYNVIGDNPDASAGALYTPKGWSGSDLYDMPKTAISQGSYIYKLDTNAVYLGTIAIANILPKTNNYNSQIRVANVDSEDWRLVIGTNFGITGDGTVVSQNGIFTDATVIGTIKSNTVYTNELTRASAQPTQNTSTITLAGTIRWGNRPWIAPWNPPFYEITYTLTSSIGRMYITSPATLYIKVLLNGNQYIETHTITTSQLCNASSDDPKEIYTFSYQFGNTNSSFTKIYYSIDGINYTEISMNSSSSVIECTFQQTLLGTEGIVVYNTLCPSKYSSSDYWNLGNSTYRWGVVYCKSLNESSDVRLKDDINILSQTYDDLFNRLSPVSFRYKDEDSGSIHLGFIAQEVEQALRTVSINPNNFKGISYIPEGEEGYYGIHYTEFIALNTWQIQKLKSRITELENRIAELESKI